MLPEITQQTLHWAKTHQYDLTYFQVVNSTSTWAKETALKSSHQFRLIIADQQELGRGRNSNSWLNPQNPGDSLLSTWCFKTANSPQPPLTPRLGLGLYKSLNFFSPNLNLSIKAPNDIFLGHKKLAGLLVEVVNQGSEKEILIGLGLNVLSSPINFEAASLVEFLSKGLILEKWSQFLTELKNQFEKCCIESHRNLNPVEMSELLVALNKFPHLSTPYSRLEPDGTLWQSEKRISWSDL